MGMSKSEAGKLGAIKSAELAKIRKEERIKEYNKHPKLCAYCGKPIEYSKRNTNKFCSSVCSASYNNLYGSYKHLKKDRTKVCLNCGKTFTPTKHTNGKFCSTQCCNDYHYKIYVSDWKAGKVDGMSGEINLSRHIKRYIKEKYNHTCTKCGIKEVVINGKSNLDVHHVDDDYKNNSEDNLTLLCRNCHRETSSYGVKNRGKGRNRRKYFKGTLEYKERIAQKKDPVKSFCNICGKPIEPHANLCVDCFKKQQAKNIPPKEVLLRELQNFNSFVSLGKKYGVSDNAVRKWFKKYSLPSRACDIKKLTNS